MLKESKILKKGL